MSKFVVTKSMLEGFIEEGMTVKDMADKLTEMAGKNCGVATVRNLCKHYELNLRKKPRTFFVPESDEVEVQETNVVEEVVEEEIPVSEVEQEIDSFINNL